MLVLSSGRWSHTWIVCAGLLIVVGCGGGGTSADAGRDVAADVGKDTGADHARDGTSTVDLPSESLADTGLDVAVDTTIEAHSPDAPPPADAGPETSPHVDAAPDAPSSADAAPDSSPSDAGNDVPPVCPGTFVELGPLGNDTDSYGIDLNDRGDLLVNSVNNFVTTQAYVHVAASGTNAALFEEDLLTSTQGGVTGIAIGDSVIVIATRGADGFSCLYPPMGPCQPLPKLYPRMADVVVPTAISETPPAIAGFGGVGSVAGTIDDPLGPTHAFVTVHTNPDIGTLGGTHSRALSVTSNTRTVGYSQLAGDTASHAFFWQNDTMQDLGTLPGGTNSTANDINAAGQVVGSSDTSVAGQSHAFIWQTGTMTDLGTLGGTQSAALAINASGQVVGTSTNAAGQTRAFIWTSGTMHDLGTLGGTTGTVISLPANRRMINAAGQVVGTSLTAGGQMHVFVWTNGTMLDLSTMAALGSGPVPATASAINASGMVIGTAGTTAGNRAYVYTPSTCP